MYNMIAYTIALTEAKWESKFEHTRDTPYLTMRVELHGVLYENWRRKWERFKSTALNIVNAHINYSKRTSSKYGTVIINRVRPVALLGTSINFNPSMDKLSHAQ